MLNMDDSSNVRHVFTILVSYCSELANNIVVRTFGILRCLFLHYLQALIEKKALHGVLILLNFPPHLWALSPTLATINTFKTKSKTNYT